jgi:hypothetical protein
MKKSCEDMKPNVTTPAIITGVSLLVIIATLIAYNIWAFGLVFGFWH